MFMVRKSLVTSAVILGMTRPWLAFADGYQDIGSNQPLVIDTVMYVDILDVATENIQWSGADGGDSHSIDVYAPNGAFLATLTSGQTLDLDPGGNVNHTNGAYRLEIVDEDNTPGTDLASMSGPLTTWTVTVVNGPTGVGRLWSYDWHFYTESFGSAASASGSFYVRVPDGTGDNNGVVEMLTDGLSGNAYRVIANDIGIPGGHGQSLEDADVADAPEGIHQIYLRPPEEASYEALQPSVSFEDYESLVCEEQPGGEFTFVSDVIGTYHIVCDLNDDDVFDFTANDDLHLIGNAAVGVNTVVWDGTDNEGSPVGIDTYQCEVILTVGEFHYVGHDIETSYEGFRLFQLDQAVSPTRVGLPMFWNDSPVQANETEDMPNNQDSFETSGPNGVFSGLYASAAIPNTSARAWGDFDSSSKGNDAWLDTYTWIYEDVGQPFALEVFDENLDTDSDGLTDVEENCEYGTSPILADTDNDGLNDYDEAIILPTDALDSDSDDDGVKDGTEVPNVGSPLNTDNDGLINAMDADDDGDTVPTATENYNGGDPTDDHTDADGVPDYLDVDDDGDGINTKDENYNGGTPEDDDTDGDDKADYLDVDDDDDSIPTANENYNGGTPANDDSDGDETPDYLDTDDDGDSLASVDENYNGGTSADDDSDGDETPDYLDVDDDGDLVATIDEDVDSNDNVTDDDSDGDDVPNYLDTDDDGDLVPTLDEDIDLDEHPENDDSDGDDTPNYLDTDDDGDGVSTFDEDVDADEDPTNDDSDGDDAPNYLDTDDDGDGVSTVDEDIDADEDPTNDDTDGDDVPNYLDTDDDGDQLATADEDLDEDLDPTNDDSDGDDVPNYLDTDDDGDSVSTFDEDLDQNGDPNNDDSDGDDIPNYLDTDDDGDSVPTADEDIDEDGDSSNDDSDGDDIPDYLDTDDDGDSIPTASENYDGNDTSEDDDTDDDGTPDYLDTDDDDDGIPTTEENTDDTDVDDDGLPNWTDTDSDGDDIPDTEEGTVDEDEDGIPDFLDPDVSAIVDLGAGTYQGTGAFGCSSVPLNPAWAWILGPMFLVVRRGRRD